MDEMVMRVEQIKITAAERKRIEKFADARCGEDQSLYKARGSFKRSDIVNGALAEIAVYKLLRNYGFKVNKPDFKIYDKSQKSYKEDLTDGKRRFHVKGQSLQSARRYGHAWLMQRNDPLVIIPKLNEYLVPCSVDAITNTVDVWGLVSFTALHHYHCFGDCVLPQFNRTKTAIYLESLAVLSTKALWGLLYRSK